MPQKILKARYLTREDMKAEEIDKFVAVLELNQNYLFGNATYSINKGRQAKQQMPPDVDTSKVRNYAVNRTRSLLRYHPGKIEPEM